MEFVAGSESFIGYCSVVVLMLFRWLGFPGVTQYLGLDSFSLSSIIDFGRQHWRRLPQSLLQIV